MTILIPMVVIVANHRHKDVIIQVDVWTYSELVSLCCYRFAVMVFLSFHFHMLAGVPWLGGA